MTDLCLYTENVGLIQDSGNLEKISKGYFLINLDQNKSSVNYFRMTPKNYKFVPRCPMIMELTKPQGSPMS